jgi:hypothetical protein
MLTGKPEPSSQQRIQSFGGAGILPAIFLITTHCKTAGETPALQDREALRLTQHS